MSKAKEKTTPSNTGDGVYDLFILMLTVFSLLMVGVYFLFPLNAATKEILLWLDIPISLVFLADAVRSLRRAPDKRAYLKWGWLDFLGSIPLILPLRLARLARLVRAWRVVRLRKPRGVEQDLDQNRARGVALIMLFLALVVLTTSTVAVLEFESDTTESEIRTGRDAIWWAIVTMSTVGYGDYAPISTGGRIAAVALMTVGIGIYGVLASYLAQFFLPQARYAGKTPTGTGVQELTGEQNLAGVQAELAAVNARLAAIEALLGDSVPPPAEDGGQEPD